MRRIPVLAAVLLIVPLTSGNRAFGRGSSSHFGVKSLKGIGAVRVVVEDLDDDAKALGLDEQTIQTDAELKLRLAGMRVLSDAEWIVALGQPYLYLRVTATGGAAAYEVALCQNARLGRNGDLAAGVITWSQLSADSNPTAAGVRNGIKDLVDTFLNDWLSVNPKK